MSRNVFSHGINPWIFLKSLLFAVLFSAAASASDVTFDGVAAGDPTATDVVLWTRAKDAADPTTKTVTLKVASDVGITSVVFTNTGSADPVNDFTVKIIATGLTAGTKYYYRWESAGGAQSNVGTFKTAPSPTSAVAVKFAFSGD